MEDEKLCSLFDTLLSLHHILDFLKVLGLFVFQLVPCQPSMLVPFVLELSDVTSHDVCFHEKDLERWWLAKSGRKAV